MTGTSLPPLPEQRAGETHWTMATPYHPLLTSDLSLFGWEWLRRTPAYRRAWSDAQNARAEERPDPRGFGLERFEDPTHAVPVARPVWSAALDANVIPATIDDMFAEATERIDLLSLAPFVSLAIDGNGDEHLLLSDGRRFIRVDLMEGSLLGCPSSLRYLLRGMSSVRGPLSGLERLVALVEQGRFPRDHRTTSLRRARWILELRVADALASGANQQDIARVLFGPMVTADRWRVESHAYRQRVQRLVRGARERLRRPLDRIWFRP